VPATWLVGLAIFLVAFRVTLNVTDSNVIDVGYAGVISADRLVDGDSLYGGFPKDNEHGDTYGPVNAYAYVPFEQALPWSGRYDDLPAAHGAAIGFDVLTLIALWLLGRAIRGPTLGAALAYGWAANPFTLLVLDTNVNDALVALLVVLALLGAASPVRRGAALALAGLTKFAPLGLAPLFATHPGIGEPRPARRILRFGLAFAATGALAMAPVLLGGDLGTFYDRTLRFQATRDSPFSVWGYFHHETWQHVVQVGGVLLALVVAFVPRRRDVVQLAALAAAVLVGLQLGVTHWFYLYLVWFLPAVLVALLAGIEDPFSSRRARAAAAARSRPPAAVATR